MTKSTIHCTHPLRRGLLSRRWSSATRKVEYLLKDRLGSVDAVANSTVTIIETRGYDAFGKPRDGSWNDLNPAKIASTAVTPKGFTQHEHLNQLELIHMNGRAFDYHLRRFTGVDPFIQFPLNSQSLNPYSYILNNPLSGTDPTGYTADTCTPSTGSHVKNCETVTVSSQGKDGNVISSASAIVNKGTTDRWAATFCSAVSANGAIPGQSQGGSKETSFKEWSNNIYAANGDTPASGTSTGGKFREVLRGATESLANDFSYEAWTNDYACERMGSCGAGESYSAQAQGSPLMLAFPSQPKNLEQELGRNLAPAFRLLPALFMRNGPGVIAGLRRADELASLNRYWDEIADAPFAPGSVGAAQVWSIKSRLKAAQLPTTDKIRFVPRRGYEPSMPLG